MKSALRLAGLVMMFGAQSALAFIPEGYCTIVLSSRASLSQALEDVSQRWSNQDVTVYKSKNGWFAITSQVVPIAQRERILNREKAAGRVPNDALCSSGKNYISLASQIPADTDPDADMWRAPDVYAMSPSDRRFIQLSLALEGHYFGLMDGKWGRLSQRALNDHSAEKYETNPKTGTSPCSPLRHLTSWKTMAGRYTTTSGLICLISFRLVPFTSQRHPILFKTTNIKTAA